MKDNYDKEYELSKPIFNFEQINYYSYNGCMVRYAGMKYYEDTDKLLFYVRYEKNDIYQTFKDKWMKRER